MPATTISLQLDPDAAQAFAAATPDEQRKLQLLLNLRLRELTSDRRRSLRQVMDDAGHDAAARGLTPEILDSLLEDE